MYRNSNGKSSYLYQVDLVTLCNCKDSWIVIIGVSVTVVILLVSNDVQKTIFVLGSPENYMCLCESYREYT